MLAARSTHPLTSCVMHVLASLDTRVNARRYPGQPQGQLATENMQSVNARGLSTSDDRLSPMTLRDNLGSGRPDKAALPAAS